MKIIRIWKGWTLPEKAENYRQFLSDELFPEVKRKGIRGLEKVSISSSPSQEEVEFLVMMQFDAIDAIKEFAGEDYETAFIPEKAKRLLHRYESKAKHYELHDDIDLIT